MNTESDNWKRPESQCGPMDEDMARSLSVFDSTYGMSISRSDWTRAEYVVENTLAFMLQSMSKDAQNYEGLVLHGYMKRGSAREGLKVGTPDEFDVVLQFGIDGLTFERVELRTEDNQPTELEEIHVKEPMATLQSRYPKLEGKRVFLEQNGNILLSSRALHQDVFVALVDNAIRRVNQAEQNSCKRWGRIISRQVKPPTINIKIQADVDVIEVDIVPGLLVKAVSVTNQVSNRSGFERVCPLHCIFKWMDTAESAASLYENPNELWRVCSNSFEIYLLDWSQQFDIRNYITMGLRLLKAYFRQTKAKYLLNGGRPPISSILRSYHVKQIAFYCMFYLDIDTKWPLQGVREALGYLIDLLQVSLEEGHLPHFFHGNSEIKRIMPGLSCGERSISFDLYASIEQKFLRQAQQLLENHLREDLHAVVEPGSCSHTLRMKFRNYIQSMSYYQTTPLKFDHATCLSDLITDH